MLLRDLRQRNRRRRERKRERGRRVERIEKDAEVRGGGVESRFNEAKNTVNSKAVKND